MAWIALVLGVFLFYRFVEYRHKIIAFKISGGLLAIGAVIAIGFLLYERIEGMGGVKEEITVKYSSHRSNIQEAQKIDFINATFNELMKSYNYFFEDMSKDQSDIVRDVIFSEYLPTESRVVKYLINNSKTPFEEAIKIILSDDEDAKKALKEQQRKEDTEKLNIYIAEMVNQRETQSNNRVFQAIVLMARMNTLDPDHSQLLYSAASTKEKKLVDQMRKIKTEQSEIMLKKYSEVVTASEISFEICNKKKFLSSLVHFKSQVSGVVDRPSTALKRMVI